MPLHLPHWTDQAACKGNPTPFHDEDNPQIALDICRQCPVTSQCLQFALDCEEPGYRHGIYGGTTPRQRDEMPSRHRVIHVPT